MRLHVLIGILSLALGHTALAADPVRGAREFAKCKACHTLEGPDGSVVVMGGLTGPNLYGVIGRRAGTAAGYRRYSPAMQAAGRGGLIWTEATLAEYVADPEGFLRQRTSDSTSRTAMSYRMARGQADVAAFLTQVGQGGF
jgi:cytochrome c